MDTNQPTPTEQNAHPINPTAADFVQVPRKLLSDFIEYSVPGFYGANAKWFADRKALRALLATSQEVK